MSDLEVHKHLLHLLFFSASCHPSLVSQQRSSGRGELLLSLCYQSTTNTLTVVVLKARNLPKTENNGPTGTCTCLLTFWGCNPMIPAGTNIIGLLQNIPSSLKLIMASINGCIHNGCQKWKVTLLYVICIFMLYFFGVYSISQSWDLWLLGWTLTFWSG